MGILPWRTPHAGRVFPYGPGVRPIVTEREVDDACVTAVLTPRSGLVRERAAADGFFELDEGPFTHYQRRVTVTPRGDGRHLVRQVIDADLAIPYFGWLFRGPYRGALARLEPDEGRAPWWAPPDRLDAEAATTLAALAVLSMVLGYATILLSQTITFAADQFGADKAAQGIGLAAIRFDLLLSFPLVALTDRRGRRGVLLTATAAACVVTALGALTTSLPTLIATQVPARGLLTATAVIVTIMAAEEMPAGARAYAVGLLTMAGAGGGGLAVLLLPVADTGDGGWRILFAIALFGLLPVAHLRRYLPESRRFRAPHARARLTGHGRRLWLLAISALLLSAFFTPASYFVNEFLREDRGFSATRISLFTVLTITPGAIGIVVGGRLADVRGRRGIGAIALVGGVATTVLMYVTIGWPLWAWSTISSIVGAATVPALGVYGPELFPTALRGQANAIIGVVGRAGSVIGLLLVGFIASNHSFGTAMAAVAVGPIILAVLVITMYPETAHRSLEDLNPEDA